MKEEQKYEACIAKTTVPKGCSLHFLTLDKWYPVERFTSGGGFWAKQDNGVLCLHIKRGCCHLAGGNWKIRKIKEPKNDIFRTE